MTTRKKVDQLNQPGTLPPDAPDMTLRTFDDAARVLAWAMNAVRRGEISPSVGRSIGALVGGFMEAHGNGELEQRLVEVETKLGLKH